MYRSSALIIVCLMTAAFAGCLADPKTPAKTPNDAASDAGSDDPTGDNDASFDIPIIDPVEPYPTIVPEPAPSAPAIDENEEIAQEQILSKDCLATIGLLGIRISAC